MRVALITGDSAGHILLLNHVRPHGSYWVLPGGGVESGETIESALEREVREELGVGLRVHKLVAVGELITSERHVVDFFLTGTLDSGDGFRIQHDEGIADARWMHPSEFEGIPVLPREIIPVLRRAAAWNLVGVEYLAQYAHIVE